MSEYVADEKEAHRGAYRIGTAGESYHLPSNLQDVFTPWSLAGDIVGKMDKIGGVFGKTYLTFNLEFVEVLMYDFGVKSENIWFVSDCPEKIAFGSLDRYNGLNKVEVDLLAFLEEGIDMKFDVVIMNPPYQAPKKNDGGQGQNGDYLWQHFVEKAFSLVKEDGYVCAIHPGGWRMPSKKYQKVFDILMENKLEYLEIHDFEDGRKTFGCTTRYDWYICKNERGKCQTTIIDEKGEKVVIDISTLPIIPNAMIEEIAKITSNEDSKCADFLYSRSAYGTDKKNMSQEKTGNFIYPCVYSLPQKGHQFFYSNTNQNDHFGIPKVIWSNGAGSDVIVDKNGDYGLTQFAYAIAADRNDLEDIKKAIQSEKFQEICGMVKTTLDRYSKNFMKRLKKDFWKDFV